MLKSILKLVAFSFLTVFAIEVSAGNDEAASEISKELLFLINKKKEAKDNNLRVAVLPFNKHEIPISTEEANALNDSVLNHLIRYEGNQQYKYLARQELNAVISDIDKTTSIEYGEETFIQQLMKNASQVDLLIIGKIYLSGSKVNVIYKAVSTKGAIYGVTAPVELKVVNDSLGSGVEYNNVDSALEKCAEYFFDNSPSIQEIVFDGVRYQSTGIQPEAGRYISTLLQDKLKKTYSNFLVDKQLMILDSKTESQSRYNLRGLSVSKKTNTKDSQPNKAFKLSGSYWDFGNSIEIRILLKNKNTGSLSWSGKVNKKSFPININFIPKVDLSSYRENDLLSPIDFLVTTSNGSDPIYKIGEKLDVIIKADRDVWVYCFYKQADGSTIQIIPNEYYLEANGEAVLKKNTFHVIPGLEIYPFEFVITEPVGVELVKCFAADENITDQLPYSLRGQNFEPIPKGIEHNLTKIFRELDNVNIAENSVILTVVHKEK
ncbi:MAG: DUF4384 domain-containing protein [Candidatus Thiodiazotropha taylori]|nr:DUF4384 domain-containing protein [Candidatus Thiodiazotropha taylori]